MLYFFARLHEHELDLSTKSDLLVARSVDLKVLAPRCVYRGYYLRWLEAALDRGLREFSKARFGEVLTVGFGFESFPPEFRWPGATPAELLHMVEQRRRHDWTD